MPGDPPIDPMVTFQTQVNAINARIEKVRRDTTALTIVIGLITLIGAVVIFLGIHVNSQSACQAKQNDAFRNYVISTRGARDKQDSQQRGQLDQQVTLFDVVLNPTSTTTDRVNANIAYRTTVIALRNAILAAQKTRADNPLPLGNCS